MNNDYEKLKGTVLFYKVGENKMICNLFSQKQNFDTDYENMKKGLEYIKLWAKNTNKTISIPYKIGCGIANGDWNIVYKIIEDVFTDYECILYKLEV